MNEVLVEMPTNKYVALLDFDDTLAPLLASAELSKDYLLVDGICRNLLHETHTVDGQTVFHPDLFRFLRMKLDIVKEIARLNLKGQIDETNKAVDILKIIIDDKDMLSPEDKRTIGKKIMQERYRRESE